MKKYVIYLITLLSVFAAPSAAQTDTLHLGYCNGQYNKSSKITSSGKGYAEAAVRLTKEALSAYNGNSLVGVRAALEERINTDTLKVWVRSSLTGEDIAHGYVLRNGSGGIVKGWNIVKFDSPLGITDDLGDVYVGYSLHHKASVSAVSVIDRYIDNTSFVRVNKGDWQDYSEKGMACVEALVAGDNIPSYDLGLGLATLVPSPAAGEYAVKGTVQVHNYGTKAVSGISVELTADGQTARTVKMDGTIESLADTTMTFSVDMGIATDEETQWTLRLASIDNAEDENEANNLTTPIYKFQKNVLIEEFTTERCINCPTAAGYLHELLEDDDYKDYVNVITHHAGFYTDWLTQPCDEELTWFYNNGTSTYAPAVMFNRLALFTNSSSKPTATENPQSADFLRAYCSFITETAANAMLDLKLELNADSTSLNVVVGGLCTSAYKTNNPHICLYLLENDVKAQQQTGADGVYLQQHVNRAYNSTWGEPVEWTNRRFTYTYDFTIDPSWVKNNMEVVAFIYNYDETDPTNCEVDNSASAKLVNQGGTPSGINGISSECQPVEYYNVNGIRINSGEAHGLTIIKMSDGTYRKQIVNAR